MSIKSSLIEFLKPFVSDGLELVSTGGTFEFDMNSIIFDLFGYG